MPISIPPVETSQPPVLHDTDRSRFEVQRLRFNEGKREGCELIVVNGPGASAAICPTRRMSLWQARLDGVDCKWHSPVKGPVHPAYVPLSEGSGLGWLDGFDELLVRCGLRSFGAPDFDASGKLLYPLHGHIGNLPADNVQIELTDDDTTLKISGDVSETRFLIHNLKLHVEYEFELGRPSIIVRDRVTNAGGSPATMQLLYHINFGKPLLDAGCQFYVAAEQIVARDARADENLNGWSDYLGPTSGYVEQVYFAQPISDASGRVTAVLENPNSKSAVAVHYSAASLPYFTLWKNTACEATGYVTGMEPGTGFPNPRSFEERQGRIVALQPGESRQFEICIEGTRQPLRIAEIKNHIQQLQDGHPSQLSSFRPDWCLPR